MRQIKRKEEYVAENADMVDDNSMNLQEWLLRLKKHEARIFVREKVGKKWDAVPLTKLSPEKWAEYVSRWIEDGSLPVYAREVRP